ncbi:MAG: peptide chain release factor N(5)-glutamine methyltransferase [Actinobacteria bacterium]|nr:peptide chain release factor N(5)-glutamine methyltransferase [Actinomycetota bacterium]
MPDIELTPGVYTWGALSTHARAVLAETPVESPDAEARWLIERAAGGRPDGAATAPAYAVGHVIDMLERRLAGEPLQHVLGRWAFRRLELVVDHRALIPRVETEVVAEVALEEAVRQGAPRRAADGTGGRAAGEFLVADLGTGSGVLALALVDELPTVEVWATDVSSDAMAVARANLAAVGLAAGRVRLAQGSWFDALPDDLRGRLQVIVSNPPYVGADEFDELPPEVRDHEPREALVGGPTGIEALEEIVVGAPPWLAPDGALVCELAPAQATRAVKLAVAAGFAEAEVRPDLAGRDRVLVARRPQGPSGNPAGCRGAPVTGLARARPSSGQDADGGEE